jgi:RimJ/RimL family protein N-acetyltransferase
VSETVLEGGSVRVRRAGTGDVDFLAGLYAHEDVEPFLAPVHAGAPDAVRVDVERSLEEPDAFGLFVIEEEGRPIGTLRFERTNARSRIARLAALAVHPSARGRRLADDASELVKRHLLDDLGYHRLELEIYGFNERGLRQAERAGFVREGVRRKAYWRHGEWVDGVLFGLTQEDLANPSGV